MAGTDSRFFIIPNMIDDAKLSPSEFRLYAHLKRVCGDSRVCTETERTLAERCNLSSKTVCKAKEGLRKAGLITKTDIPRPNGKIGKGHAIKLTNIKALNQAVYEKGSWLQDSTDSDPLTVTAKEAQKRYRKLVKFGNTTIPKNFEVTDEMKTWADLNAPEIDIERETERFIDITTFGNSQAADWVAFWKKWIVEKAVCKKDGF